MSVDASNAKPVDDTVVDDDLSSVKKDQAVRFGARLRAVRADRGLSLRALAREVGVSPSFVSQLETGKNNPSVATLHQIAAVLGVGTDDLLNDATDVAQSAQEQELFSPNADSAVVRLGDRRTLELDSGVKWEELGAIAGAGTDFKMVTYEVGGSSSSGEALTRHNGAEYGYVVVGTLEVTLGFDRHVLGPGDSIAFSGGVPHRIANVGDEPVQAVWFVQG